MNEEYQLRWVIQEDLYTRQARKSELKQAVLGVYKKDKNNLYMWIADFINKEALLSFLNIKELPEIDEPLEG